MTPYYLAPKGNEPRLTFQRNRLLASVGIVVMAVSTLGSLETAAAAQATPAQSLVQVASFADLVTLVQPAVVSIVVQTPAPMAPASGAAVGAAAGATASPADSQSSRAQAGSPPTTGEGSGFFISPDGYIVTANHVIDQATSIEVVTNDGSLYPARVVGTDPATDLALVKVDAAAPFASVSFADQPPRVGDWVVAVGSPYGLANTVTAGIVSALARDVGDGPFANYLQVDAPINPGNSGGPTFDVYGNVVGVNEEIYTPSGGSVGIGFDAPADTAKPVVAALEATGHVTRGWLGLQLSDLTAAVAKDAGLNRLTGAVVAQSDAGSPAAGAGIKAGDIITAVNGTSVTNSRSLAQTIAAIAPGTSVELNIVRAEAPITVDLNVDAMPATDAGVTV
jgi:serine protease Do